MTPIPLSLDGIRECLDGVVPGMVATIGADGVPNLAYISQAQYVDSRHLAMSFQFFNTTRRNILAHPHARLVLVHPLTARQYRLSLRYLRTETEGPLFEKMKAKLAGIASHSGMSGVFRLQGSDIYEVQALEEVPGESVAPPAPRNLLAALRGVGAVLGECTDLDTLLGRALEALEHHFDIRHAMVLLLDQVEGKLFTVASRGYPESGIGSEIALGAGIIGVAARERTAIRIGYFTAEYAYSQALRESATHHGLADVLDTEIPLPGLAQPQSQLAVPMCVANNLLGVLCVESDQALRFGYDDEDALATLAAQLGMAIHFLQQAGDGADDARLALSVEKQGRTDAAGSPVELRHYAENDSIFIGGDYLIKGVAGSILWTLARDHVERGRAEFSNRELRLDPRIRLPDLSDNLEARLLLLSRRLEEKHACMRIEKSGRGRFRFIVNQPLSLVSGG